MRLRQILLFASTLTTLAVFTGCATESAWTVRDRTGWPVQSWQHRGFTSPRVSTGCEEVGRHAVDPDSAGLRVQEACGIRLPGYNAERGDEDQARAYARLHDRR